MLAEYAAAYGGPPMPDTPWPLFRGLVRKAGRFGARRLLDIMDGTAYGAASLFPGDGKATLAQARDSIFREAYPNGGAKREQVLIKQSKDDDAE